MERLFLSIFFKDLIQLVTYLFIHLFIYSSISFFLFIFFFFPYFFFIFFLGGGGGSKNCGFTLSTPVAMFVRSWLLFGCDTFSVCGPQALPRGQEWASAASSGLALVPGLPPKGCCEMGLQDQGKR